MISLSTKNISFSIGTKEILKNIEYDKGSLEFAALTFIRENCEKLRFEMLAASKRLDFETAAVLRDRLRALQGEKEGK